MRKKCFHDWQHGKRHAEVFRTHNLFYRDRKKDFVIAPTLSHQKLMRDLILLEVLLFACFRNQNSIYELLSLLHIFRY